MVHTYGGNLLDTEDLMTVARLMVHMRVVQVVPKLSFKSGN